MSEDLHLSKVRNMLDFQELKIAALNRGLIMLMNVLIHKGVLNENEETWIDKIKRDGALSKAIDTEKLMGKLLEICSKTPCPEKSDAAITVIKNYTVRPKINLPKL
jgi:hypothetical protein